MLSSALPGSVEALSDEEFSLLERAPCRCEDAKEKIGLETFEEAATRHRPAPPCPLCGGKHYAAFLRAIFDDSKKDLPTLVFFIELMCYNVPLGGIAKICGLNHKIAYEWRQRVFTTVDAFGQARKRGLSKQKLCIAVAIDACKYALAVGHGKPSHISGIACALTSPRGSTVVGDMEKVAQVPGQGGRRRARGLQGTRQ